MFDGRKLSRLVYGDYSLYLAVADILLKFKKIMGFLPCGKLAN